MNNSNTILQAAADRLQQLSISIPAERIPIAYSRGRICAEMICASEAVPAYRSSALDGFALRSKESQTASSSAPVSLRIAGVIAAGSSADPPLKTGEAFRIMTGAPLPEGADAIVRLEDADCRGNTVSIRAEVPLGAGIRKAGATLAPGCPVISPGEEITSGTLAALASLGISTIPVYRSVRVALYSTGSELVSPSTVPGRGQIRSGNTAFFRGELEGLGAVLVSEDIIADDVTSIANALEQGLAQADLILSTGGVGGGDFDLLPAAIQKIGGNILFQNLPFFPGGGMLAAEKNGKVLFCLSGSPGASRTIFALLVQPFIRALQRQLPCLLPPHIKVQLTAPLHGSSRGEALRFGSLAIQNGCALGVPLQHGTLCDTLADADLLLHVPSHVPVLEAGAMADAFWLGGKQR